MKQVNELKDKIKNSPLKMNKVAELLNISDAHFSMMLSGKANMPEETRNKIKVGS